MKIASSRQTDSHVYHQARALRWLRQIMTARSRLLAGKSSAEGVVGIVDQFDLTPSNANACISVSSRRLALAKAARYFRAQARASWVETSE